MVSGGRRSSGRLHSARNARCDLPEERQIAIPTFQNLGGTVAARGFLVAGDHGLEDLDVGGAK